MNRLMKIPEEEEIIVYHCRKIRVNKFGLGKCYFLRIEI